MNYILAIFLILQLLIIYFFAGKNILSVSVLSSLMFLISATLFALFSKYYDGYEIGWNTITIIISSNFFLLLGELLANNIIFRVRTTKQHDNIRLDIKPISVNKTVVIIVALIGFYIGFYSYYRLFVYSLSLGNSGDILRAVEYTRVARVQSTSTKTSLLSYIGIAIEALSYIYYYVYIYNYINFNLRNYSLLLPIAANGIIQISSTERIGFIKIIVIIVVVYAIVIKAKNGWNKNGDARIIKIGVIGIAAFIAIFVLLGSLSNRLKMENWIGNVAGYICLSIMGLDKYLQSPWKGNKIFGQQTLYLLYFNLNRIGFNFPVQKTFLPFFYWSSGSSNTYTSLVAPLEDYGVFGMLLTRIFIGFFYKVYTNYIRKVKNTHKYAFPIILFAIFMYPVAITSIADSYLFFLNLPRLYLIIALFIFLHGRFCIINDKKNRK